MSIAGGYPVSMRFIRSEPMDRRSPASLVEQKSRHKNPFIHKVWQEQAVCALLTKIRRPVVRQVARRAH